MSLPVEFSPTAAKELSRICDYLEEEYGLESRRRLQRSVANSLVQIGNFPLSCPPSEKRKDLRKCVVTAYTVLLYRIKDDRVEVAAVFDGRRDYPYHKLP